MDIFTDYDYSALEFDTAKAVDFILAQKPFENIYEGSEGYVDMRFSGLDYLVSSMQTYHALMSERKAKRLDLEARVKGVGRGLKFSLTIVFLFCVFLLAVPATSLLAPVFSFAAIAAGLMIIAPSLRLARAARVFATHSDVHDTEVQTLKKEMSSIYEQLTDFADTLSAQERDLMHLRAGESLGRPYVRVLH